MKQVVKWTAEGTVKSEKPVVRIRKSNISSEVPLSLAFAGTKFDNGN